MHDNVGGIKRTTLTKTKLRVYTSGTCTAKNAQVITSLLTSCNKLLQQAGIRMRSHGLRQLGTTSLLQVVNRLVAS